MMLNYKIHKLKNGVNLITVPMNDVNTVNTIVYFPVGSRYESQEDNGISHFIEHMMFKGTEKRENTLVISTELDSMGAQFNAYTGKDLTAYYVKSSKDFTANNIEILADMICNSKFDIEEINKERGVIIQEMKRYEDLPEYYVEDVFEQLFFGEKDKLGQLIIGNEQNLKNFTREQFINYKNTHYFAENAFICVVGNIDEDNILELVEKNFVFRDGIYEMQGRFDKTPVQELRSGIKRDLSHDGISVKIVYKDIEQAHLKLGFPAFSYFEHENHYALSLFSTIFGECMSSRLFINIREKHGLCYSISSGVDRYQDCGIFSISSGLDKDRIYEAIELIKQELINVRDNGITDEELQRAKSIIFGRMDISLEDSSNVAEFFGRQYLFQGRILSSDEKRAGINLITKEKINDIIKNVIDFKNLKLAVIGSYKDDSKFLEIIK